MIKLTFTVGNNASPKIRRIAGVLNRNLNQAMQRIAIGLQGYIQTQKLSGQVLHHRSGKLIGSIRGSVVSVGSSITALVVGGGGAAPYGRVHEYGGTFAIPEHTAHRNHATRHSVGSWSVRAHSATFPERSFMRSSLDEWADRIVTMLEGAVSDSVKA